MFRFAIQKLIRSAERVTEFEYDPFGQVLNRRHLADLNTQQTETSYTYDDFGNVSTETNPLSQTSTWIYNVMGGPLEHTNPRQKVWRVRVLPRYHGRLS
jgi:YD repeat-containing protein